MSNRRNDSRSGKKQLAVKLFREWGRSRAPGGRPAHVIPSNLDIHFGIDASVVPAARVKWMILASEKRILLH